MMKLSICLLLAVVAAISADEDLAVDETESSGYVNEKFLRIINHQPPARTRQESGLMLLRNRWLKQFFGSNRRLGIARALEKIGPTRVVIGLFGVVIAVAGVAYIATELESTGRGLDTPEWEVIYSVWMNQLQKDLEDTRWQE